jgi:hypothetical protein
MLVVVVRGELIRRYPDVLASAVRAESVAEGVPRFAASSEQATLAFSMLRAPDVLLAGFDLTCRQVHDARGARPWWFLLAEHPTAPRFGVVVGSSIDPGPDHSLAAGGVGGSADEVAGMLLRKPVRAAFDLGALVGA